MRAPMSRPRRLFMRSPIFLLRLRLGWLLGGRFLLLETTGRRSGKRRFTALEIPLRDPPETWYVASGWGFESDWYRNLEANAKASVTVGFTRFACEADLVGPDTSAALMARYSREHPRLALALASAVGWDINDHAPDWHRLGRQSVPWVRLTRPTTEN